MVRATISSIRQGTPTVRVFTLTPDEPMDFKAGQWLDFYVEFDGEMHVGGYSMTSSPLTREHVELAIKQADVNPVSRYLHERVRAGEEVELDGGQGECYYDAAMVESGAVDALVLVAGGIGITPLMSIVRYACEATPGVPVLLLYSATSADELLFRAELESLAAGHANLRCEFRVTRGDDPLPGAVAGRIDAARLAAAVTSSSPQTMYYVCGPPGMIDEVVEALRGLDVPAERVRFERWW